MDDNQEGPIIRKKQMETFSQAAEKDFEDRMVVHLTKFFPEQCKSMSEPQMSEVLQYGIQRAATYDIVTERDVCKYIDLMFIYGIDFDKDSEFPWAGRILNDKSFPNATAKTDHLYETAMAHARQVAEGKSEGET